MRVASIILSFGLTAFVIVQGAPTLQHDESVAELVDYFTTRKGVYYSPKQQIRYEKGMMGVFATQRIEKGELLCSVPWHATINAGRPIDYPSHLVCDTVRNLVREMKLGDESEFGPYVKYLLNQRHGQLPSAWSKPAKELLRRVLDDVLPPFEATDLLTGDWHDACGGADNALENNAAMLVIQRAEDDLMVPVYDFYNHRNGDYLNTVNHRRSQTSFDVTAARGIEVGEQIYISYNMCSNCGNRADTFGTPDMFRDYGFVEAMPQRWVFFDQHYIFDLHETDINSDSGSLEVSFPRRGRPGSAAVREEALLFFRQQIMRLEKLKIMEEMKESPLTSGTESMSEYEWDTIWRYSDAIVTALKHLLEEELGSEYDKEAESTLYESLEGSLPDQIFYASSPIKYTATCDNEEAMRCEGHTILESPESLYQEVIFFDMPDGDMCLEIDEVIQTCAKYRPHYHELVVDFPARYIDPVRRILFVGGGDSMILAEALKYPALELVVGLELDQVIVRNSFKYFHTQPHFDDKRVEWWFGDAVKSLKLLPKEYFGSFDLVLVDLSETVASFAVTEHLDMLEALALLLSPQGIMVKNEWVYLDKMSSIFQYTARLNMQDVPLICEQALTMGSQTVDFFNHRPNDHNITRRLLGPQVDIDERYNIFHDYQKNNLETSKTCDALEESSSDQEDGAAGVLLVVNAENTHVPLAPFGDIEMSLVAAFESLALKVLSSSSSTSEGGGTFGTFVFEEGYVSARTWPEQNYCAFDIHLWGGFSMHESIKDALLKVVGSDEGSSYRVVGGGMLGASSWHRDKDMIGPRSAHAESCSAASASAAVSTSNSQHLATAGTVLKESLEIIKTNTGTALVVCGPEGKPCPAKDVLSTSTALWTCDNLGSADSYNMIECENQVLNYLSEVVSTSGRIGAIVVDESVPVTMLGVVNSILGSNFRMDELLADPLRFVVLMADDDDVMRRKHNFLDKIRKNIANDPVFKAELVLASAKGRMEMGIVSADDEDFFPRLYNVTSDIEAHSDLDVQVRKVLGGRWKEQSEAEYNPREYRLEDYDISPGVEQFLGQKPMGRQSIFQLEVAKDKTISRTDIERALLSTFSKMHISISELKTETEIGDGFATSILSPTTTAVVLWDGNSSIHINLFSHNDSAELSNTFIRELMGKIPVNMIQRDEQPRGTGRVVNFGSDIAPVEKESGKGMQDNTSGTLDRPMISYECPILEPGSGENDIAGYFDYYDNDRERHANNVKKSVDYYTKGFRSSSFGGRAWTYSEMKQYSTEYKAKYYGDALKNGDWIYEGASGEAFNLLMTLEILKEERGIENLRAFGSDYLAESAKVADELFTAQAEANSWILKGKFCRADSTDLSFVPANTFDLAFTYVDPMVDALHLFGDDVSFDERVAEMKEYCESDDEEEQEIVDEDQEAQEEWHSKWVKELIRITKPGGAIIIEDVDTPICNESSEWGGVATDWWKDAVEEYGWDVDPSSIDIVFGAWYGHR